MKALTVCQPYPWLIMTGEKLVENRTWYTPHRGPLAIHAGKSRDWLDERDEERAIKAGDPLVFGAFVCVVNIIDCLLVSQIKRGIHDHKYPKLRGHAHAHGPWCWIWDKVTRLPEPVPYRGQQKLFDVDDRLIFPNGSNQGV